MYGNFLYKGMLGANLDEGLSSHVTSRLALIGGTSTCHMAVSLELCRIVL